MVPASRPTELDRAIENTVAAYRAAMDANLLHQGALSAIDLARAANGFVGTRAPWTQAKDPAQSAALDDTLGSLARAVAVLATLLHPFMPGKMSSLAERLGLELVAIHGGREAVVPEGNLGQALCVLRKPPS